MIHLDLVLEALSNSNNFKNISNEKIIANARNVCSSEFPLEDRYVNGFDGKTAKYIKGMDKALQGIFVDNETGNIKTIYCFSKIFDIFKDMSLEQFPDVNFAYKNAIIFANDFFHLKNYHVLLNKDNPIIIKNFTDYQHCVTTKVVHLNEEIDGSTYCYRYLSAENTLNPMQFSPGIANGQLILVFCHKDQYVFNKKITKSRGIFFIWIDGEWLSYVHLWAYPRYPEDFMYDVF